MVGYSEIATFDAPKGGEYDIASLYADDLPEDCRAVEVWDDDGTFLIEQQDDEEGAWVRVARLTDDGDKALTADTLVESVADNDERRIVYLFSESEWHIEEQIQ
mgnify:CR=1 FL=1